MTDKQHYTVGSWCGHTQYNCAYCPYDVLEDENAIIEHVFRQHINIYTELPVQSIILMADKSGREKKRR